MKTWNDFFKFDTGECEREQSNRQKGIKLNTELCDYAYTQVDDFNHKARYYIALYICNPYRNALKFDGAMKIYGPEFFKDSNLVIVKDLTTDKIYQVFEKYKSDNYYIFNKKRELLKQGKLPENTYKFTGKQWVDYYQNLVKNL